MENNEKEKVVRNLFGNMHKEQRASCFEKRAKAAKQHRIKFRFDAFLRKCTGMETKQMSAAFVSKE